MKALAKINEGNFLIDVISLVDELKNNRKRNSNYKRKDRLKHGSYNLLIKETKNILKIKEDN
ncbi:MAG: hypothetical protein JJE03_02605 [Peptostreptococcaceae bacterium]|nr:hypothetical protein [Peptostreptococcaceae bacterium]